MNSNPTFLKYPEIPHLMEVPDILDEDCLEVYEKLDGGNSQVRVYGGRIFTGSRANFLNREEYFRFDWFKDFNSWAKSNYSFYNLPENLIVYGEFLSPHTLKYKPEFTNKFFLIDAYDLSQRKFIPYEVAKRGLEDDLGVKEVLFLDALIRGRISMAKIKKLAMDESQYSNYGREGIVIKNYNGQKFAKLWRTSVDPTKKGVIEEIKKTLSFLINNEMLNYEGLLKKGHIFDSTLASKDKIMSEDLFKYYSEKVCEELRRSGRDISLAEISKTIKKVVNKI